MSYVFTLLCQNPSTSNVQAFNWKSEWIDERKKPKELIAVQLNQQLLGKYYRDKEKIIHSRDTFYIPVSAIFVC